MIMATRWIDSHVHVSRYSPDGTDRGDILPPLLEMVEGAGARLECILSVDLPEIERMRREPECVVAANRYIHGLARRAPGQLFGSCMVNPHFLEASLQAMDLCFGEWGFVQLGEMLQYIMEFEMDAPAAVTLAKRAVDLNVPMQIHVSTNTEKGVEHLAGLLALAGKVPELKIVVAHCLGGAMSDYYLDALGKRRAEGRAANLWVEIRDFNHVPALRRALAEGWEGRLLAGTDWTNRVGPPFLPYGVIFGVQHAGENPHPPGVPALEGFLRQAGATPEQIEKVAWRNAVGLFGMPWPGACVPGRFDMPSESDREQGRPARASSRGSGMTDELYNQLFDCGCIRFGEFRLRSGLLSPFYPHRPFSQLVDC